MNKIFVLLLFTLSVNTFSIELVQSIGSIKINASIDKVYDLVSSPMNDHLWRSEVNSMTTSTDSLEIGSWFREDAWIGIRKNFITTTEAVELIPLKKAIFVTVKNSPYYLKSSRFFKEEEGKTVFSYVVDFDRRMIKRTFGLNVSPKVVMRLYSIQMKKYLKSLKVILEK